MTVAAASSARVLALCRYAEAGASSRVRMYQYIPHLERLGISVVPLPLLPDTYVDDLYAGRSVNVLAVARAYLQRVRSLLQQDRNAVLWVEKELFPWLPARVDSWFLARGRRVVIDCDDAVWLRYQSLNNGAARALLGGKFGRLFGAAHCITAGNRAIGEFARHAGAADVRVIPSVVDRDRYAVRTAPREPGPLRIGWIGTPSTVHYLRTLGPVLKVVAERQPFQLVCVGGGMLPLPGLEVDSRPWILAGEADAIRRFDIGVMPLTDGEWERGKCGYKLIQYMACGVPVVGSRVGANMDIVSEGVDGLLAGGNAEWIAALESLLTNPELAARLGAAGRHRVEREFSVQSRCAELAAALRGD